MRPMILFVLFLVFIGGLSAGETAVALQKRQPPQAGGVYKSEVRPHWFRDNTRFWYRNDLRGGAKEFILVDVEKGGRNAAFDHEKLAAALSKASGGKYQAERLPFDAID